MVQLDCHVFININRIIKHQKMAELTNSNVQFFHSQSSFGSEALSNSRMQDLADQLIDESNTIFFSLREILVPREDLLDQSAVRQILHRARIMHRDTIPQNLTAIQRTSSDEGRIMNIKNCDERLRILLENYQNLKDKKMAYQEFYNLYGRAEMPNFSKKQPMEINIQPDIVQIYESVMPKSLKGAASKNSLMPTIREGYKEKQIQQLKDEIHFLKKKQKNFRRQKEEAELRMKTETDDRIKRLIKMHKNPNESYEIEILKQQLLKCQSELENEYAKNKKMNQMIQKQEETIKSLKLDHQVLKQELESNRRIAMGNSRLSEQSDGGRSVYSDVDHGAQGGSDVKKLQKVIKNLNYQKNLLRNELTKERETFYKIKKAEEKDLEQQVAHLKKAIEKKNNELAESHKEVDRYKVENIKLVDQYQKISKQLGAAKNSVQNFEKMGFQESRMSNTENLIMKQVQNHMDISRAFKLMVSSYTGDGDEGYPYFDMLNKQFKIRFKRSCLRDKELLHKSNGLEVGVISQYSKPNEIKIVLHLSNFCDQEPLLHLNLKISNSKSNKISSEKTSFDKIEVGQQVKTPIYFTPRSYPLGSTILICEYEYYGKKEEVRVLLPAHIFKMVTIKPKDGQFREISTITVPSERKIAKNIEALKQYFKGATVEQNKIKASLMHDQSETKVLVEIDQTDQNYVIRYEHRSGDEMISEYLVKTLAFLLKKEK